MLDNHKFLAIAITVSITGVLALFFYAASISPEEMAIADIDEGDIGSLVKVNGTVRTRQIFDDGSGSYEIIDLKTNASIIVYVETPKGLESPDSPTPGAMVEVTGIVEEYQGFFEIVVKGGGLVITSETGTTYTPVRLLLSSPETFDGMTVWTSGTLESPYIISDANGTKGMGFELQEVYDNHTYRLACVVFDNDMIGAYETGSMVEVSGTFQYYEGGGSWQVMMDDENNMFIVP